MQGSAGGMMGMPGYGTAGGVPAVQQPTDHVNLMNMMQAKPVNIQPMQFTPNLNVSPEFMTKEMEAFDQVMCFATGGVREQSPKGSTPLDLQSNSPNTL